MCIHVGNLGPVVGFWVIWAQIQASRPHGGFWGHLDQLSYHQSVLWAQSLFPLSSPSACPPCCPRSPPWSPSLWASSPPVARGMVVGISRGGVLGCNLCVKEPAEGSHPKCVQTSECGGWGLLQVLFERQRWSHGETLEDTEPQTSHTHCMSIECPPWFSNRNNFLDKTLGPGKLRRLRRFLITEIFTFSQAIVGKEHSVTMWTLTSEKILSRFLQTEANSKGTTLNFFRWRCFGFKRRLGATFLIVFSKLEMIGLVKT